MENEERQHEHHWYPTVVEELKPAGVVPWSLTSSYVQENQESVNVPSGVDMRLVG